LILSTLSISKLQHLAAIQLLNYMNEASYFLLCPIVGLWLPVSSKLSLFGLKRIVLFTAGRHICDMALGSLGNLFQNLEVAKYLIYHHLLLDESLNLDDSDYIKKE